MKDLLDTIAENANTDILSDLRYMSAERIKVAIQAIRINAFTLAEWKEAYYYLLYEEPQCADRESLVRTLLLKLGRSAYLRGMTNERKHF